MSKSALLLAALVAASLTTVQCLIDFSQNTPNPFQGQNLPPDGIAVADFPVEVYALVEDLYKVDEQYYTFTIVFGLLFQYNDSRTVEAVMNDDTGNCTFYCSSDPTASLNALGDPACCDRAFIPGVTAVNLISFEGQEVPADYKLSLLGGDTVAYYSRTRGSFSVDLEYKSYPFDKHFFAIDFKSPFRPLPSGGTFVERVDATLAFENTADSGYKDSYRPSVTAIDLPAWRVIYAHFEVMNFTTAYAKGGENARDVKNEVVLPELSGHGFRISIEVERQKEAFYIIVEVIPICLIVAFSFACFTLPIQNVKARFNVLAGQFLTLIVLQFILYTVLPSTYQVIKPYILICVSYVMTFLMCGEVIVASWLQNQYKRNLRRKVRKACKAGYKQWRERVIHGQVPRGPATATLKTEAGVVGDDTLQHDGGDSSDNYSFVSVEEGRRNADQQILTSKTALCERDDARLRFWQRTCFFHIGFVREIILAWHYMGRPDSQDFCAYISRIFDRVCCLSLATAYIVVVVVLFALAATEASASADYN